MSWNPNSNKHKAQHGGYKKKHSQKEINALCQMYAACLKSTPVAKPVKQQPGAQLSLF